MPELAVVASYGEKIPAVGLKHLNDFPYFVASHKYLALSFDAIKVVIFLYITKYVGIYFATVNKKPSLGKGGMGEHGLEGCAVISVGKALRRLRGGGVGQEDCSERNLPHITS